MKNAESINTETLVDLINQLTEINKWLTLDHSTRNEHPVKRKPTGEFLFDFDPSAAVTKEDYERYQAFYTPATEVLRKMGIRPEHTGYSYILDAVKIVIDRKTYEIRLKNDVYPLLSMKYRVRQSGSIEHGIRNAINAAYTDYMRDPGSNAMGVFLKRPTNKQFILYVAEAVNLSMMETIVSMKSAG